MIRLKPISQNYGDEIREILETEVRNIQLVTLNNGRISHSIQALSRQNSVPSFDKSLPQLGSGDHTAILFAKKFVAAFGYGIVNTIAENFRKDLKGR